MKRKSISFYSILPSIILVAVCARVWAAAPTKPNILFIVADDMGYADVGFQGCKDIPTPSLDALATAGVRFTNGYVSGPYCSPTRAGLMTGRYQTRFGHEFSPPRLNGTYDETSVTGSRMSTACRRARPARFSRPALIL